MLLHVFNVAHPAWRIKLETTPPVWPFRFICGTYWTP